MKRRNGLGLLALLVLAFAGFFAFAPGIAERSMNQIAGSEPIPVSDEARALHATLTIVDLHADTLLWQRNLLHRASRGHVDLPRLEQGNVALQVFSSVTKSPRGLNLDRNTDRTDNITLLAIGQLQPVRTWFSLLQRSLYHAHKLDRAVAASHGHLFEVRRPQDIAPLLAPRTAGAPVGALMSVEGLHDLQGNIDNLDRLYAAGVRMAGLTHFFDNEVAGSMHGVNKGGLTTMGRAVVRRMEDMGMIVDLAHCSHECVAEVLLMARRPVISSHGGVRATCDTNRNLDDEEIRGLAATGGVLGIGYWDSAVCGTDARAIARAMRHVRDLVGVEHVALGSDYDGSVTVPFDTSQLVQITQALLDEGFTHEEVRAVMGGNAVRVIAAGIVPMADMPAKPAAAPAEGA